MPGIEAAIANRIEREIVPALNGVYTPAVYGFAGSNPVYPYAASFSAPNPGTTNTYQGTTGNYQGLLPVFQSVCASTQLPCSTSLLSYAKSGSDTQTSGSGSIRTQSSCTWSGSVYTCLGEYNQPSLAVTVRIRVTNVAMGLRKFDTTKITYTAMNDTTGGWGTQTIPFAASAVLNTDGSATITVVGTTLPDIAAAGWGTYANYSVAFDRAFLGNHAVIDTADATVGWFSRNEWFRQTYYAVAAGHTAATQPASCTTGTNCLTVSNVTPAGAQRAILILGGRTVNGNARPSAALADYFESGNATSAYTRNAVNMGALVPAAQRFNDRIVVVGSN